MYTVRHEEGFCWIEDDDDIIVNEAAELYAVGILEPNYSVPAIREHFEFGWSLSGNHPVLIHAVQGVYDHGPC